MNIIDEAVQTLLDLEEPWAHAPGCPKGRCNCHLYRNAVTRVHALADAKLLRQNASLP